MVAPSAIRAGAVDAELATKRRFRCMTHRSQRLDAVLPPAPNEWAQLSPPRSLVMRAFETAVNWALKPVKIANASAAE